MTDITTSAAASAPPSVERRLQVVQQQLRDERERRAPYRFECPRRHPRLGADSRAAIFFPEGVTIYIACPACRHLFAVAAHRGKVTMCDLGLEEPRVRGTPR